MQIGPLYRYHWKLHVNSELFSRLLIFAKLWPLDLKTECKYSDFRIFFLMLADTFVIWYIALSCSGTGDLFPVSWCFLLVIVDFVLPYSTLRMHFAHNNTIFNKWNISCTLTIRTNNNKTIFWPSFKLFYLWNTQKINNWHFPFARTTVHLKKSDRCMVFISNFCHTSVKMYGQYPSVYQYV